MVHVENECVFELFPKVYNQVLLSSMGDIIGLNMVAVKAVFDMLGVKNQKMTLEKIVYMFNYYCEKVREK